MPLNFASVVVALISMSGLPPLAGFGGKWLLLSAMVGAEVGYGLTIGGLLATFIGFLYACSVSPIRSSWGRESRSTIE